MPIEQLAGHRYVSEEAYAFPGAYIHDSQDPEPTNISQLVRHKVERPAFVQNQRLHQRCPHAYSPFTAAEMANRQLFLSVKPEKLLAVHDIPFSPRLDKNPPITKAQALPGDDCHPFPKNRVIGTPADVASRPPATADGFTRSPFAHPVVELR